MARWREILALWKVQLKCMDAYNGHVRLWVRKVRDTPWRKFFSRCREAIKLLRALVIIEQCSWCDAIWTLHLTHSHWNQTPDQETSFEPLDRLYISLKSPEMEVDIYSLFFFGFDENSMRDEFRSTMQEIYRALTPEETRRLDEQHNCIPVDITISMEPGAGRFPTSVRLHSAVDLVGRIPAHASEPLVLPHEDNQWRYRFPFRMKSVAVTPVNAFPSNELGVPAALIELLGLGVQLGKAIDITTDFWFTACSIRELGPILQSFTDEASFRAASDVEQVVLSPTSLNLDISPSWTDFLTMDTAYNNLGR